MRVAVFADSCHRPLIEAALPPEAVHWFQDYDGWITGLPAADCQVMLVARAGASGMESARAARVLHPTAPLLWFSDDEGFGPESYRVGCTFFSSAPLTAELLQRALARCE